MSASVNPETFMMETHFSLFSTSDLRNECLLRIVMIARW